MRAAVFLYAAAAAAPGGAAVPRDPAKLLKAYTIDLDQPPEQRWAAVAQDYRRYIGTMVKIVKTLFNRQTTAALVAAIQTGGDVASRSDDYAKEIRGLGALLNISYEDMIVWNSYYELSKVHGSGYAPDAKMCTSIVAQNANGSMYLGHNFDYPTYFSPGMINARFVKGGRPAFEFSVVAGTVGPMAGVVPGVFAVAINARNAPGHDSVSLSDAVKAAEAGAYPFIQITRRAMEVAATYDDAIKFYRGTPMIAPGYLIVSGGKPGEGAVVTTNCSAMENDVWELKNAGGWYIVQTNYDHWDAAPKSDDRRNPAIARLEDTGAGSIAFDPLWTVLTSAPNYRGATISTHLIDVGTGEYRAYLMHNL